jgi:hypothetical protein
MRACHCEKCQRLTGSAFLTAVTFPDASITIVMLSPTIVACLMHRQAALLFIGS